MENKFQQVNVLYKELPPLKVLESLFNRSYHFIYLDIPRFTGAPMLYSDSEYVVKHIRSNTKAHNYKDRLDEFDSDEAHNETEFQNYSRYITRVVANVDRILTDDGILAFLAPMQPDMPVNYKFMLDQVFPSVTNVTIHKSMPAQQTEYLENDDYLLYFCSKIKDFRFPVLLELPPKDKFRFKDETGLYRRESAFRHDGYTYVGDQVKYEWHGIIPSKRQAWQYSKDEMDNLFEQGRVEINNGKPYVKYYRDKNPVPISTRWEYNDDINFSSAHIDAQSIARMFLMFVRDDSRLLCPYDWDGKFSYMADKLGVKWTSIAVPGLPFEMPNVFPSIPKNHYETRNFLLHGDNNKSEEYEDDIAVGIDVVDKLKEASLKIDEEQQRVNEEKSRAESLNMDLIAKCVLINEITNKNTSLRLENEKLDAENIELKAKIEELTSQIREIREAIGDDSSDEDIDEALEKIHEVIEQGLPGMSVREYFPEAQDWVHPYWDKLELESQHFIPTGVALYNQFREDPDADMAASLIEYCKSLERELFQKLFSEFVKDLLRRGVNVHSQYIEAFHGGRKDKIFAKFLANCLEEHRDNPAEWKFEMGKMITVLKMSLDEDHHESLFKDFEEFLYQIFERGFIWPAFLDRLIDVKDLRNDCAHPYRIGRDKAEEGRELIKEKLMMILEYYKDEDET